jgi:uncharacterized protein
MRMVIAAIAALLQPTEVQQTGVAQPTLQPGETLLQVEARGIDSRAPDVATMTAGIATTGRTAATALQANSAVAQRIIAAIRAANVESRDVQTRELHVEPVFDTSERAVAEGRSERIIGYRAQNRVILRLRDLGRAPELIDAMLSAGANMVDGPEFSLSDDTAAGLAAQTDAIRRARQDAETYAAALGMRVARILRVNERGRYGGEEETIVITGTIFHRAPVEPGQVSTRVHVWVDFALVPR